MSIEVYLTVLVAVVTILVPVMIQFAGLRTDDRKALKIACLLIIVLLLVAIIALTVFFITQTTDESDNQTVVKEQQISIILADAIDYANEGDYEKAIAVIEKGLGEYPDSAELQSKQIEYSGYIEIQAKEKVLADAKKFADSGEFESAMSLIQKAIEIHGADREFSQAYLEYQKAFALSEADAYAAECDYVRAIGAIVEAQKTAPTDSDLLQRYTRYCEGYVAQVLAETDKLFSEGDYSGAVSAVNAGLKLLPDNVEFQNKLKYLNDNKPIPIADIQIFEEHTPNDPATSVSYVDWDEGNDLDITMNKYSDGLKVTISNMFTSMGSTLSNPVTSKLVLSLQPTNHTDTEFQGIIVLDKSMYGSSTAGTIRMLVNNEEVFTTGKIDGNCQCAFPFNIDITGADTIVVEANVILNGCSFVYGIVE